MNSLFVKYTPIKIFTSYNCLLLKIHVSTNEYDNGTSDVFREVLRDDDMKRRCKEINGKDWMEEQLADYDEFSEKLRAEKQSILMELDQVRQKSSNPTKDIGECIQMCRNLAVFWEKGDYRDKQRVQKIAFPDGMYYSKKTDTVRTPRVNELIRVSSELSKILGQKETGGSISFDASSRCVPRVGLEPTRVLPQWCLRPSRLPFRHLGLREGKDSYFFELNAAFAKFYFQKRRATFAALLFWP